MDTDPIPGTVELDVSEPIWDRVFMVNPLVVIGSHQGGGAYDLAPKHMALPIGWQNYFGFVCTPKHRTYLNIRQEKAFTVSYPRPTSISEVGMAASPRRLDDSKPLVDQLPTVPGRQVDALFLSDSYLYLECELNRLIDGFGENSLIVGKIIAAYAGEKEVRSRDRNHGDALNDTPLLAYISPDRFSHIRTAEQFPFPPHFKR